MSPNLDHPPSLFVHNLAPQTTKADLDAHFSSIGPLRRSLIVTDNDSGLCKGFGFVHFALQDDATKALSHLNGSFVRGRKISLDVAKSRQRAVKDDDGGLLKKEAKGREARRGANPKGAIGMRTVIVKRTDGEIVDEKLVKERIGDLEEVLIAGVGKELRCTFNTWAEAGKAAAKIHGNGMEAWIEALAGGKKTRLIVRNLPFRCSVEEIRVAFGKLAPVREVRLEPTRTTEKGTEETEKKEGKNNDGGTVRCAGFGFVEYFLVADAKFAMSKMNGAKIGGRIVAVDMALEKSTYLKKAEEVEHESRHEHEQENTDGDREEEENVDSVNGTNLETADSDQFHGEKGDETVHTEDVDVDLRSLDSKEEIKKKPPQSSHEEMARTVFVRNLLFETSASELWNAMSKEFGRVEQAVLVKHPVTKRPRGTAFVRFARQEDAEKAVVRCGEGDTSETRSTLLKARTESFSLQGRPLLVCRAVDRTRAKDLEVAAKLKGKKEDPRNLRLAWIGQVKAGTEEATGLSEQDLSRLAKSEREKRDKLSRNPNAFVSETRLNVRNIPRELDDKMLKQMFLAAVEKGLWKEYGKSKVNANRQRNGATEKEEDNGNVEKNMKIGGVRITYCKIIRDYDRNGRSKGYGFVEFERHEHALAALRVINNNPNAMEMLIAAKPKALKIDKRQESAMKELWGDGRRLLVEFSVEDRRKVEFIKRIKERGKKLSEEHKKRKLDEGVGEKTRKRRKRKDMKDKDKRGKDKQDGPETSGRERATSKSDKKSAVKRKRAEEVERKAQAEAKQQQKGDDNGLKVVNKRKWDEFRDEQVRRPKMGVGEGESDEQKEYNRKRRKGKTKEKKSEREKKFESLVKAYKRKLGSRELLAESGAKSTTTKAAKTSAAELSRWFE